MTLEMHLMGGGIPPMTGALTMGGTCVTRRAETYTQWAVMRTLVERRGFLKGMVGGAAGLAAASLFPALGEARTQPTPLTLTPLSDTVTLVSGAGGNIVALHSAEGVLLVDGGLEERTGEVLKALEPRVGKRPVVTAFNTHWHWDHTGSNEYLHKHGAKIIAHENTRLWLGTEIWSEWENRTYKPRPAAALPTETFYKTGKLSFGDEPVEYGWLGQAHTDGDIYVYFRRQNVLVAGDVLAVGSYPILDYSTGGWIGGMQDATQKLLDLTDEHTRFVPGTGPLLNKADVAAEHEMLATLREDFWQLMRKGYGAEDMIAARATQKYDAKWGNADLFIANAYRGLYGHTRSGELRGAV